MQLGTDRLLTHEKYLLKGKRVGLLGHQASSDSRGRPLLNLLCKSRDWKVTTLFGPEHGFGTVAQDMEPVASGKEASTWLPIHSLYGHTEAALKPTPEMLENIDVLVVDLQDIGSRYYTYIWTLSLCMQACGAAGKKVIVCDRPNPINGVDVEGEVNQPGFSSFVGLYPIPARHGMTIGELAGFLNKTFSFGCDLKIVAMEGWRREWFWNETGLQWINPSPNMRSPTQALLYPGMCLLEATNVSEGRGTDAPFEFAGAPWVDNEKLISLLEELSLTGIRFEPIRFTPNRQKWEGQLCHGVKCIVTDRTCFKPYRTGVAFIWALYQLFCDLGFSWRKQSYEFVSDIPAIDLLTGSAVVRQSIEKKNSFDQLSTLLDSVPEQFLRDRASHLLY